MDSEYVDFLDYPESRHFILAALTAIDDVGRWRSPLVEEQTSTPPPQMEKKLRHLIGRIGLL